MENLIERILLLEKEAQKVMDDAETEKQNLKEEIESEIKSMEKQLNDRMENKISEIREMEEEVAKKRIETIERDTQASLKRLQSLYEQHKKEWENMLFDRLFST